MYMRNRVTEASAARNAGSGLSTGAGTPVSQTVVTEAGDTMNKNGIGQAARRRKRQSAVAAARAERESNLQLAETHVTETEIAAAAIHEAAHVIAGFHWNAPMGKAGVSLTHGKNDVAGFSDTAWTQLPNNRETWYASHVATLIAPFAEFVYRDKTSDDFNWERMISSARGDFAIIASVTNAEHSPEKVPLDMQMNYGRMCFLIWFRREPENFVRVASVGAVSHFRDLVSDADAMLKAYWEQIVAFANALLSTDNYRISQRDVNAWRDANFRRCRVVFSAAANMHG